MKLQYINNLGTITAPNSANIQHHLTFLTLLCWSGGTFELGIIFIRLLQKLKKSIDSDNKFLKSVDTTEILKLPKRLDVQKWTR